MPKLHGAKVLSGLGRAGPFTRNAMLPRSPRPQRRESRVGRCLYKIADSRHGFWVSAIDLSGRVGWELRSCFCGQCIGLQKSDSIRPKQISLKGCFWKKTARVFPYENCSHNQHDTSVYWSPYSAASCKSLLQISDELYFLKRFLVRVGVLLSNLNTFTPRADQFDYILPLLTTTLVTLWCVLSAFCLLAHQL